MLLLLRCRYLQKLLDRVTHKMDSTSHDVFYFKSALNMFAECEYTFIYFIYFIFASIIQNCVYFILYI